jgi:hypothetical protein
MRSASVSAAQVSMSQQCFLRESKSKSQTHGKNDTQASRLWDLYSRHATRDLASMVLAWIEVVRPLPAQGKIDIEPASMVEHGRLACAMQAYST